jgi:hypothetical protein
MEDPLVSSLKIFSKIKSRVRSNFLDPTILGPMSPTFIRTLSLDLGQGYYF